MNFVRFNVSCQALNWISDIHVAVTGNNFLKPPFHAVQLPRSMAYQQVGPQSAFQ